MLATRHNLCILNEIILLLKHIGLCYIYVMLHDVMSCLIRNV